MHGFFLIRTRKKMQVAPIYGEGVLISMPTLAERLIVGEGVLVQWSLQQTSNTGLGLTLLVEEVLDRSDKLQQFCLVQENLDVVHNVAATLQSCSKLLAKCDPEALPLSHCSSSQQLLLISLVILVGLVTKFNA